jgi:dienelactone hydrolase
VEEQFRYINDGFEGILYRAQRKDDRLLIVIQGLKGLELPSKYAALFAGKGYSTLAMSYYGGEGQKKGIFMVHIP